MAIGPLAGPTEIDHAADCRRLARCHRNTACIADLDGRTRYAAKLRRWARQLEERARLVECAPFLGVPYDSALRTVA